MLALIISAELLKNKALYSEWVKTPSFKLSRGAFVT